MDIRNRVDQDRGFLKRVQLLIPGFRGYRQGEDIREADSMLRMQVADQVHQSVDAVQRYRQALAQAGQFQAINDIAQVLSELQILEGKIRQAEQGYSGIAPAIRVNPSTLDQLYQYDYGFVSAASVLFQTVAPLGQATSVSADAATMVQTVRGQVQQLQAAFQARLRAVEGIQV